LPVQRKKKQNPLGDCPGRKKARAAGDKGGTKGARKRNDKNTLIKGITRESPESRRVKRTRRLGERKSTLLESKKKSDYPSEHRAKGRRAKRTPAKKTPEKRQARRGKISLQWTEKERHLQGGLKGIHGRWSPGGALVG